MKYEFIAQDFAQAVKLTLEANESIIIEPGSALCWDKHIHLEGKMNSNGKKGLKGVFSSVGRTFSSGESFFITHAKAKNEIGHITVAPATIGSIKALNCDETHQYRLNTGTFLAADGTVSYTMRRQEISQALLGGTGGLFVMETSGTGTMLISGFGDILEIDLDDDSLIIDNNHVLAWDTTLDYRIEFADDGIGFKTAEGLTTHFRGSGKVFVQTRNMEDFASTLPKYLNSDA